MLQKISTLSTKGKILLIIIINLSLLTIVSLIAYTSISKLDFIKQQILTNSKATQYQLTADMMHDALRADCYNAMLTDSNETEKKIAVKNDIKEHSEIFNTSLEQLNILPISDELKKTVNEVRTPINNYIKTSNELLEKAIEGKLKDKTPETINYLKEYDEVFDALAIKMEALSEKITNESIEVEKQGSKYANFIKWLLVSITIFASIVGYIISSYISKLIISPIKTTENLLQKIAQGEEVQLETNNSNDESSTLINSMKLVVENLNGVKTFVKEVGEGNFETEVNIFNNNGEIYESLLKMKNTLHTTSIEDKNRNWISQGLAKFAIILRNDSSNIDDFYDNIISNLVKYLKINQGGLFIIEKENNQKYLKLASCYAFDRKKILERKIAFGEGLVGQCVLEKETILLTEIPQNYVNITSGLGGANPSTIIIVPLKINDEISGVLELASFTELNKYQIEFIEKVAESIASSVISISVNERTKILLEQAQQQTEEMRAQEEEMRQNLEEMSATQEEMERKELEMHKLIEQIRQNQNT